MAPEVSLTLKGQTIKDVLHYYNNSRCKFMYISKWGQIIGTFEGINQVGWTCGEDDNGNEYEIEVFDTCGVFQPILHHVTDMNDEQKRNYKHLCKRITDKNGELVYIADTPDSLHYLCSNAFDAFDLIENGHAIDAASVPQSVFLEQQAILSYQAKPENTALLAYVAGYMRACEVHEQLRTIYNSMSYAWTEIKKAASHHFYYKSELQQIIANIRKYANEYYRQAAPFDNTSHSKQK